ncbi:hypothetical protein H4Q26_001985 [Puccinia striiformis f. sp. tritici PST-130]|nr:hypothetical protein H4Q26_001985 [Puccinia striiformis f. sp. tritici PST-130]
MIEITVPEIEKALIELKRLMAYRATQHRLRAGLTGNSAPTNEDDFLGVGLTSLTRKKGKAVDARCRDLTSAWACEKGRADPGSVPLCDFHEKLENLSLGILSLEEFDARGNYSTWSRTGDMSLFCSPTNATQVSKELLPNSIVVFDEAHNIDNVCIESLSIDLTKGMLDNAGKSIGDLDEKIREIKRTDASKLQNEYERLVRGLVNLMMLFHLKKRRPFWEIQPLRFCAERLTSLIRTLELTDLDQYNALQKVASFATLVATYEKGFLLILEPFETENATVPNPVFHLTCIISDQTDLERFSSVIITSGTISPLEMYPKMLGFEAKTPDAIETSIALENYRRACDNGKGAVLLSVARGKVSEGIDFDHNYGRAVIMFGIPYQYTESRILKARLEFLRDNYRIRENDYLTFDAMRHAAQCVGRVLRRFAKADKRAKLPKWINSYITETASNLCESMAQPFEIGQDGISLWGIEDILNRQAQQRQADAGAITDVNMASPEAMETMMMRGIISVDLRIRVIAVIIIIPVLAALLSVLYWRRKVHRRTHLYAHRISQADQQNPNNTHVPGSPDSSFPQAGTGADRQRHRRADRMRRLMNGINRRPSRSESVRTGPQ